MRFWQRVLTTARSSSRGPGSPEFRRLHMRRGAATTRRLGKRWRREARFANVPRRNGPVLTPRLTHVQMTLSYGMSFGCGLYGHDIGGFAGKHHPSPELLVRWCQNGAWHSRFTVVGPIFSPFSRPRRLTCLIHSTRGKRYRLLSSCTTPSRASPRSFAPFCR